MQGNQTTGAYVRKGVSLFNIKKYLEQWLQLRLAMHHQPSSVQSARKDLQVFLTFCEKQGRKTVYGSTFTEFFQWLGQERGNGAGAINRKASTLKMYIRFLASRQIPGAAAIPIQFLPRARQPYAGPVKTLEVEEVQRLLGAIVNDTVLGYRDFALYTLIYALGLRISEALNVNLSDIDWLRCTVTIRGKGRRERTLPIIAPLMRILRRYRGLRNDLLNAGTNNALFLSKKGNRLAIRTAEENFQKLAAKAGPLSMQKITPHTLRHCFASHALETEAQDIVRIKAILGHASLKTTEIYLHPSLKLLQQAVNDHLAVDILEELRPKRKRMYRIQDRQSAA
jgi:site-specific recombinase XerD